MKLDQDRWICVGPPEIGTRVHTFAFLPGKSGELIAGTRPDGFYKINVNNKLWQMIDVDCQFTLGIGPNQHSIAISPHDHSLIFLGIEEHGIMRSTDAGSNWLYANTGLRGKQAYSLNGICFCFHPQDKRLIFYGSDGGIYRSSDSGQTWVHLLQGIPSLRFNPRVGRRYPYDATSVFQLGTHPAFPDRVYAGFYVAPPEAAAGMYVSNDAGESWQPCSGGLPEGKFPDRNDHKGVLDFAISDTDPEVIFAGVRRGLFMTRDGGNSWRRCAPFQTGVWAVCLHPGNTSTVFAGLEDGSVHVLNDFATTWRDISQGLPVDVRAERVTFQFRNYDGTTEERTDYRWRSIVLKLGINPEMPDELYAATPFGLFKRRIG